MKTKQIFLSLLLFIPTSIALAEEGNTHSSTTDAAGTTTTTEISHSDTTGITGTRKVVEEEKTEVDPKGLMNKKTAQSKTERNIKKNGDYSASKVVDHANGTKEKITLEKDTDKHLTDGGKTTTTTETHSIDPKGLGNKQEVKVKEKVKTAEDGTKTHTVTKEVNGETVSEAEVVKH